VLLHNSACYALCRFDLFEAEARRLLADRLPVPAYDHLLKLSHCFNVLDARGAVGVTERANCFATLRALSREVTSECGLWLAALHRVMPRRALFFTSKCSLWLAALHV